MRVDARLNYSPQGDTLREFHKQRDQFVRVMIGPLASGKTQAMISEILICIDNQAKDVNGMRRSRWVCARNTQPDLHTTTIKDFREITDEMEIGKFTMGTPPTWEGEYTRSDDGSTVQFEVLFIAFDLPSDAKKARGLQLTGVWFNEMKELSRSNTDMLMARVGRFPPRAQCPDGWNGCIGDTNAPDRDHYLVKLALEVKPAGWWFGIQPGAVKKDGGSWRELPDAENLHNLPKGYYQRLLAGRPESWIRQNLGNEFVFHADGRPVHPDFNESLHVQRVLPTPSIPLTVGIDFGRTPAAAICQQQHNGSWYVLAEFVTTNTGALQFGKLLRAYLNDHYAGFTVEAYGDPAGNAMSQADDNTPFMMLEVGGIVAWPAPTNDYEERTTVLDQQLTQLVDGNPAFLIDPSCVTCIKGLAGAYMFRRVQISGEDRFHDKPVKDSTSHVVEALHYGMLGKGLGDTLYDTVGAEEFNQVERWAPPASQFQ